MEEQWKDIPGYEGLYQVSNYGQVKSLSKQWIAGRNTIRTHNGKILKARINSNNYYLVVLCKNSKCKSYPVHKLVAMVFLNHRTDGTHNMVIDHIDNNKLNNRINNLQIVSNRINTSKDKKNGTSKYIGVSFNKKLNKWQSQIYINKKNIVLGNFDNEEKASQIYQLALSNINSYNGNNKEFRELLD